MPLPKEESFVVEDIYSLPDGVRAELIDGQIYYMSPPGRIHQQISMKLSQIIANYIDAQNGSCQIYAAPFAVFLNEDDKNYVEPDISVICDPNKLNERGCNGAPDWIIEIVSPGSRRMDYTTKFIKYQTAGVKEYWIVDPMKQRVIVWNLKQPAEQPEPEIMEMYTFHDTIKVGIYEDLYIDFSELPTT